MIQACQYLRAGQPPSRHLIHVTLLVGRRSWRELVTSVEIVAQSTAIYGVRDDLGR